MLMFGKNTWLAAAASVIVTNIEPSPQHPEICKVFHPVAQAVQVALLPLALKPKKFVSSMHLALLESLKPTFLDTKFAADAEVNSLELSLAQTRTISAPKIPHPAPPRRPQKTPFVIKILYSAPSRS
jgi:hypothetical protein